MNAQYRERLARELIDFEFRHSLVKSTFRSRVTWLIRTLREKQGLSQKELGEKIGKQQTHISRMENPLYGTCTLESLLEIFKALDAAIFIDAIPFGEFLHKMHRMDPDELDVPPFNDPSEQLLIAEWVRGEEESSTQAEVTDATANTGFSEFAMDEPGEIDSSNAEDAADVPRHKYYGVPNQNTITSMEAISGKFKKGIGRKEAADLECVGAGSDA